MKIGKFDEYKGFIGNIEYSHDDNVYFGRVLGINDILLYESGTIDKLYDEFKKAVDILLQEVCVWKSQQ